MPRACERTQHADCEGKKLRLDPSSRDDKTGTLVLGSTSTALRPLSGASRTAQRSVPSFRPPFFSGGKQRGEDAARAAPGRSDRRRRAGSCDTPKQIRFVIVASRVEISRGPCEPSSHALRGGQRGDLARYPSASLQKVPQRILFRRQPINTCCRRARRARCPLDKTQRLSVALISSLEGGSSRLAAHTGSPVGGFRLPSRTLRGMGARAKAPQAAGWGGGPGPRTTGKVRRKGRTKMLDGTNGEREFYEEQQGGRV